MGQLTHDDLDALIWGGGASRQATDPALDARIRHLQVAWAARLAAWLVQSWINAAWSTDAVKATGILLLLYALSFFLYVRGRHALNLKLLLLLSLVGLFMEIIKPVVAIFRQRPTSTEDENTLQLVLRVVSVALALVMLLFTVRIMLQLVRVLSPKKSARKRQ